MKLTRSINISVLFLSYSSFTLGATLVEQNSSIEAAKAQVQSVYNANKKSVDAVASQCSMITRMIDSYNKELGPFASDCAFKGNAIKTLQLQVSDAQSVIDDISSHTSVYPFISSPTLTNNPVAFDQGKSLSYCVGAISNFSSWPLRNLNELLASTSSAVNSSKATLSASIAAVSLANQNLYANLYPLVANELGCSLGDSACMMTKVNSDPRIKAASADLTLKKSNLKKAQITYYDARAKQNMYTIIVGTYTSDNSKKLAACDVANRALFTTLKADFDKSLILLRTSGPALMNTQLELMKLEQQNGGSGSCSRLQAQTWPDACVNLGK